jgi:hypothetical protein
VLEEKNGLKKENVGLLIKERIKMFVIRKVIMIKIV